MIRTSFCHLYFLLFLSDVVFISANFNFNVEVNEFKPITEKSELVDWDTIRLKKIGRNELVITGDFVVNRNIVEEQEVTFQVYMYKNKRRGSTLYTMKKSFCKYIKEENSMYEDIKKVSNLPEANCPFPKGEYSINNYKINLSFLPPAMPKGDYLIVAALFDKGIIVAELQAVISIN